MAIRDGTTDDDKIEIISNVSLGRGSFEMLGTSTDKLARVTSKLEMARDSLEILRKTASKLSFNERRASTVGAVDEFRKTFLNNFGKAVAAFFHLMFFYLRTPLHPQSPTKVSISRVVAEESPVQHIHLVRNFRCVVS